MIVLAIDTTTRGGSVAVTDDDRLVSLVIGDESRTHGERVPGEIARALDEAGVARTAIDLIAVAAGPGAFTGLRIGLATAQGLALTLDRPAVGVSALDALAWTVSEEGSTRRTEFVGAWMDAQRGDVFAALYRLNRAGIPDRAKAEALPRVASQTQPSPTSEERSSRWSVVEEPLTAPPQIVLESWTRHLAHTNVVFIGDAAPRDEALISEVGKGHWHAEAPGPLAPAVATLGRRLALDGRAGKPHLLTPIYVRRPDAEIERERRRAT